MNIWIVMGLVALVGMVIGGLVDDNQTLRAKLKAIPPPPSPPPAAPVLRVPPPRPSLFEQTLRESSSELDQKYKESMRAIEEIFKNQQR